MNNFTSVLLAVLIMPLPGINARAEEPLGKELSAQIGAEIVDRLKTGRQDLTYEGVSKSPVPGIYEVKVVDGPTLYVVGDGEYFFDGDLYKIEPGRFVNLRQEGMTEERRTLLANVPVEEMIVFTPKRPAKGVISVFTDVDCGFCRKLHQEVSELNRLGIEIRYLAFPRAGIDSPSYDKVVSAWCAESPTDALTELKNGGTVPSLSCPDNPVASHYKLGLKMGVTGTPALVFADGTLIHGYRPAADLAGMLGIAP